tara:strand:- start:1235 stop:2269 length:1035 start_codon:yes stop_codon:yes gene_type:complete
MDSLSSIVRTFPKLSALVIGDVALDKFTPGILRPYNPESKTVSIFVDGDPKLQTYKLGCAGNVAANASMLDASVSIMYHAVEDEGNRHLRNLFDGYSIFEIPFYDDNKQSTIVKERCTVDGKDVRRRDTGEYDLKSPLPDTIDRIVSRVITGFSQVGAIILSDYNKGAFKTNLAQRIIQVANQYKIKTIVDMKPHNFKEFERCTVAKCNDREASLIVMGEYDENKPFSISDGLSLCREFRSKMEASSAIVTYREHGMCVYDGNKELYLPATNNQKDPDVTGAGDTVGTIVALAIQSGDIFQAARLANIGAGRVVAKPGTATVSDLELLSHLKQHPELNNLNFDA